MFLQTVKRNPFRRKQATTELMLSSSCFYAGRPQEDVFCPRRRGLKWQLVRESFWLLVNKSSSREQGLGNYQGSPGLVLSLSS